jgi:vacuolar protein sorting-associated protein 51
MVEHRSTAREIKNLDTDMQQLVTENYHKFIAATDHIRAMKTEVDTAMPDLSKLSSIMSEYKLAKAG